MDITNRDSILVCYVQFSIQLTGLDTHVSMHGPLLSEIQQNPNHDHGRDTWLYPRKTVGCNLYLKFNDSWIKSLMRFGYG